MSSRYRNRKPIPLEVVQAYHDGKVKSVQTFLAFHNHEFFFQIPGADRVYAPTMVELRRKAMEVLEDTKPLEWRPVIIVDLYSAYDDEDHSLGKSAEGASVSFRFRRLEVSRQPDWNQAIVRYREERERGRVRDALPDERACLVEREHEEDFEAGDPDDDDRLRRQKSLDRFNLHHPNPESVELPYEKETWDGLFALKRVIDSAHGQLRDLLGRADLAARLKAGRFHLLPEKSE